MVIRTQKITRPKRMVSRSRLSTPTTPSRHATMLHASERRRSCSQQQVGYVDHEGGVEQERYDHARQLRILMGSGRTRRLSRMSSAE
jgi:hypothetical protein